MRICEGHSEWSWCPFQEQPLGTDKWDQVPPYMDILPTIWAMHCKQNITTNEVKSHKARFNIHGGNQVYGANYYENYAQVVT